MAHAVAYTKTRFYWIPSYRGIDDNEGESALPKDLY